MQTPPAGYDTMVTRNRVIGSPMDANYHEERDRRSRSPRPKKRTRKTKAKSPGPDLPQPLSELTKDYTVPIKDIETFINRPAETRWQEAKTLKKTPRPMNSFMLYRSAYSERVKKFCEENNHQVISKVTGKSWPMEPKEIHDLYDHYARVEKENHMKAHPDYKFTPNKNTTLKKRRWADSDNESDVDDPDWRSSRGGTPKRPRSNRDSRQSTPYDARQPAHPMANFHPSSWHASNVGKAIPQMVPASDLHRQYYQSQVSQYVPNLEDVNMRKTIMPGHNSRVGTPLVGMPGGDHQELLQSHSHMSTPVPGEVSVDPALFYGGGHYPQYAPVDQDYQNTSNYQYGPTSAAPGVEYQYISEPAVHPGMQTLTDNRDTWEQDINAGADFEDHFRNL